MSTLQRAVSEIREAEVETAYAWLRLLASVCLSTIGGVGMWSVVVAMPALQAEFGVRALRCRCRRHRCSRCCLAPAG